MKPMNPEIPDKLFFKIGEVAAITGVKPHVLRYWESEFGNFSPSKSRSKQRQYKKKDIELVVQIKDLLYRQGFTIAGARKVVRSAKSIDNPERDQGELLLNLRAELVQLRDMIKKSSVS